MKALVPTLLLTILVTAFCSAEAVAAGIGDIVLAMPFDEGEGEVTMDISPHRNHGTLMENAGWGIGKFGNAIHVEPVGYVDAGKDESLSLFDTDFTLAVWVNMKETVAHQHGFMAQDEGGGPQNNKWMLRYDGRIDEAIIATRAFTEDEIKTHFEGGVKQVLAVQPEGKSAAVWGAIKARTLR
jgi:hypothetical protein